LRFLCLAGTPSIKNRKPVLPGNLQRKNNPSFLQETVAFIFSACTLPAMLRPPASLREALRAGIALQAGRAEKLTPHLHFLCGLRDPAHAGFKLFS
jgi:hypothetical protein